MWYPLSICSDVLVPVCKLGFKMYSEWYRLVLVVYTVSFMVHGEANIRVDIYR